MSSSDEEVNTKQQAKKGQDKNSKKAGSKTEKSSNDFQIKPANGGPSMDTSNWPLLLKVMKPNIKFQ